MFEGFTVIALTTIVLVLVAIGVIIGVAIARRPADQWQSHLRTQTTQWSRMEEQGEDLGGVTPQDVSLDDMIDARATEGSAYVEAETLPGYDRLETAAERIDEHMGALQERRPRKD